jgi:hypothetical protein
MLSKIDKKSGDKSMLKLTNLRSNNVELSNQEKEVIKGGYTARPLTSYSWSPKTDLGGYSWAPKTDLGGYSIFDRY